MIRIYSFLVLVAFSICARSQTLTAGVASPAYQLANTYGMYPEPLVATVAVASSCPDGSCITYQWQKKNGTVWQDITGQNSRIYNIGLGIAGAYYRMKTVAGVLTKYTNECQIATQTSLISGPTQCWVGQSASYYYYYGDIPNYQWDPSNGSNYPGPYNGVGSISFKWISAGQHTITLMYGGTAHSLIVNVINKPLDAGRLESSFIFQELNMPMPTFYAPFSTGGSCLGSFSYQWQVSTNGASFSDVPSATSANYTPGTATADVYYRRRVTCSATIAYTDTLQVKTYPYFDAGTITSGNTDSIAWNSVPSPVTGGPSTGGTGSSYSYEWEYSTDGGNFIPATGNINGMDYQAEKLATNTYFRRKSFNGQTVRYTNVALVKVKVAHFSPGSISPYTAVIASGTTQTMTGTPATGGTSSAYIYQWQQSSDETNWQNCMGAATSKNYTSPALTRTTYFRRLVTNGAQQGYAEASSSFNVVRVKVIAGLGSTLIPNSISQATADPSQVAKVIASFTYPGVTDSKINSVRTWDIEKPGVLTVPAVKALTNVQDYNQTTSYLDDLGRSIQSVSKQASPAQKDMISDLGNYDVLSRQVQQFLPYADITSTGSIKTNFASQQPSFYNTLFSNQEGFYYSSTEYEASPENRVLKTSAPGRSWTGSAVGIRSDYTINTALDSIKMWNIDNYLANIPTVTGEYATGSLAVIVTTDEHENKIIEYKDREGKVILKKVQISDTLLNGYRGWLNTYYVYDVYNRLRVVVPPAAIEYAYSNSWVLSSAVIDELCFKYFYDGKGRQVVKKVPGAGSVYMIYDNRDRLVFVQDSNMSVKPTKEWSYTLFDGLNRSLQTGIMLYSGTREALANYVGGLTDGTAQGSATGGLFESNPDLFVSAREIGRLSYQAAASISITDGFSSESGAEFTMEIVSGTTNFTSSFTYNTNPIPNGAELVPLVQTYYDNYVWTPRQFNADFTSDLNNTSNSSYGEAPAQTAASSPIGLATGMRVRVLEDPTNIQTGLWMERCSFFDDKFRPIQNSSDNYNGGVSVSTTLYSFTSQPLCIVERITNPQADIKKLSLKSNFEYDHIGRLLKVTKTVWTDSATSNRVITRNTYDELGRLNNKKVGQKSDQDTDPLEDDAYNYNIRGWLKAINWNNGASYTSQVNSAVNKWFGMDISHDWGFASKAVNGNISGIKWESGSDNKERAYGFSYDAANRMLKADFTQMNSGAWNISEGVNFSVKMGDGLYWGSAYDANGNIKSMLHYGVKSGTSLIIDNMSYSYLANSNKLQAVTESAAMGSTNNHLGDFTDGNRVGNDYEYDLNGNMIVDRNKGIAAITYNHLNLPSQITVSDKGTVKYIYDAIGTKLEKRVDESASAMNGNSAKNTKTSYLGVATFTNDSLQFAGHEEGRVRIIPALVENNYQRFAFDYLLKDHLGNVRMVLTDQKSVQTYMAATMEPESSEVENKFYYNVNETRSRKPPDYPAVSDHDAYAAKVDGKLTKIGPYIILKAKAGDRISIKVKAWHRNPKGNRLDNSLGEIATLAPLSAGKEVGKNVLLEAGGPIPGLFAALPTLLRQAGGNADPLDRRPEAYLNWVEVDEQGKAFTQDSVSTSFDRPEFEGFMRVGDAGELKVIVKDEWHIKKSGFVYIFTSNETSSTPVLFDDLQITVLSGPVLEETHYYPFGLTMAGISSKASDFGAPESIVKYQSYEQITDFDLNLYESFFRTHDPQLGRFWQLDPKPHESLSLYAAMENNPIKNVDFLGDTTIYYNIATGAELGTINNAGATQRVRVNERLYNRVLGGSEVEYNAHQEVADFAVSAFNGMLDNMEANMSTALERGGYGTNVISRETGELSLTFIGDVNSANTREANGSLDVRSHFDDGGTLTIASYSAVGGPYGNGSPENGTYTADNLRSRRDNLGMIREGVGFSMNLNPTFQTGRSLLRIHPDGNRVGTLGCVGLQVNSAQLTNFRNIMRDYLQTHPSINVNININGNPNNNGRGARVNANGIRE